MNAIPHWRSVRPVERLPITVNPDQPHIQRWVRDILRFAHAPGRALDIGCGKGEVSLLLQRAGFQCMGIDMKPRLIENLQASFPQVSWRCAMTVIRGCEPLIAPHLNLTVELPRKAIVCGYSWTVVPITWHNRGFGTPKLKLKEMGSRYFFIVAYVWLEKYFSRGDYRKQVLRD